MKGPRPGVGEWPTARPLASRVGEGSGSLVDDHGSKRHDILIRNETDEPPAENGMF